MKSKTVIVVFKHLICLQLLSMHFFISIQLYLHTIVINTVTVKINQNIGEILDIYNIHMKQFKSQQYWKNNNKIKIYI